MIRSATVYVQYIFYMMYTYVHVHEKYTYQVKTAKLQYTRIYR